MAKDDDVSQNPEAFLAHALDQASSRKIAYEEFYYLLGRYPFLEISHSEASYYPTTPPEIKQSSVGWKIHVYDQLMISSQSELFTLFLTGMDLSFSGLETTATREREALKRRLRQQAQNEGSDISASMAKDAVSTATTDSKQRPVGTVVNQVFVTGLEMVMHAKAAKWPGIRIIGGYYPMQRAAWIACEKLGLQCLGFEASPEDHVVHSWVKSHVSRTLERVMPRGKRR